MTPIDVERIDGGQPEARFSGGSKLGKRYTHPADDSLEILVTKEGAGSLSDGPGRAHPQADPSATRQ